MVPRLSRQDWIDEALMCLASRGHAELRADKLAKRLGVSRGSFYWHFTDVPCFEKAVLDHWEVVTTDRSYEDAIRAAGKDPTRPLQFLIERGFRAPDALERGRA